MELTIKTNDADSKEIIELVQRLIDAIDKLEELVERMEQIKGE